MLACQTSMGRTGSMFAYQDIGAVPDILVLAKGLGAGFRLSAIVTSDRISPLAHEKGLKYLASHMRAPFPYHRRSGDRPGRHHPRRHSV
jgi:2,2-dialkylglycine decarboxylase (pyruvate)